MDGSSLLITALHASQAPDPHDLPVRLPPPRPNRHGDRLAWNDWFETELAYKYEGYAYNLVAIEKRPDNSIPWRGFTLSWLNLEITQRTKELMETEGILIAMALQNVTYGSFEAEWKGLGMERKRELALEGLYRGSCDCPADNLRHSCPELRIESLIGGGEYNLINLLKRIIAHDPTGNGRVTEVFLFEHPYVTHEFRLSAAAPDGLKAWIYMTILLRNFCIVDTLLGILQAFNGHPFTPKIFLKPHASQPRDAERLERTEKRRECNSGLVYRDKSHREEMKANTGYICIKCTRMLERKKLRLCGGCQLVYYCGSECQKKHWPEHKKICGKQDFDVKSTQLPPDAAPEFIGCPPVVDGYLRTPALWRQIRLLSLPESQGRLYHGCLTRAKGVAASRLLGAPFPSTLVWLVALSALSPLGPIHRLEEDGIAQCLHRDGFLDGSNQLPAAVLFLPSSRSSLASHSFPLHMSLPRPFPRFHWIANPVPHLIPITDDDRRHHELHQALGSLRSCLRLPHEIPFKLPQSSPWTRKHDDDDSVCLVLLRWAFIVSQPSACGVTGPERRATAMPSSALDLAFSFSQHHTRQPSSPTYRDEGYGVPSLASVRGTDGGRCWVARTALHPVASCGIVRDRAVSIWLFVLV
ncbi:hypothetical protein FB45DRAFT_1000539 [Roridomyces roridus]|uniref:MYND-type domain-containing protein n=1 Tax=Roridomyces roridus TaxID=1738132 RepID=A0AAD7C8Y0_9AGAR|nr:hypothetical protein FB45DRAFT_1000539 [Roridomyces roridus]